MKERPILFGGPMVRAILDGRKTQTRRIAKVNDSNCKPGFITPNAGFVPRRIEEHAAYSPYGVPGDRLWAREAFRYYGPDDSFHAYAATPDGVKGPWRPSIHMPRRISRITLEIVAVRVERLHDIGEKDARAEGIGRIGAEYIAQGQACWDKGPNFYQIYLGGVSFNRPTALECFPVLWDAVNGEGAWDKNPWVWVVEFKRI